MEISSRHETGLNSTKINIMSHLITSSQAKSLIRLLSSFSSYIRLIKVIALFSLQWTLKKIMFVCKMDGMVLF